MGPVETKRVKKINIYFHDAYGKLKTSDITIPGAFVLVSAVLVQEKTKLVQVKKLAELELS